MKSRSNIHIKKRKNVDEAGYDNGMLVGDWIGLEVMLVGDWIGMIV
jgi:hypothetical protein